MINRSFYVRITVKNVINRSLYDALGPESRGRRDGRGGIDGRGRNGGAGQLMSRENGDLARKWLGERGGRLLVISVKQVADRSRQTRPY